MMLKVTRLVFALLTAAIALPMAMTDQATAQEGYRVQSGDVLRIEVIEDSNLNRSVLVPPDGRISVPLAGSLPAAGSTVEAIQQRLASQLASNFASTPNVYVAVEKLAERAPRAAPAAPAAPAALPTIEVYALGEVGKPGRIEVAPGTTVLQLFAQMNGFTPYAAKRRIQLRRTGPDGAETVYPLDYEAIERGQSPNGSAQLANGDVIVVPQRGLFE